VGTPRHPDHRRRRRRHTDGPQRGQHLTDEDLDLLLDINLRTVITTCRASVPHLRTAGGGAIVTMASSAALAAGPGGFVAAYGAAKAAVLQYTRYLAAEVGPDAIRVNCVAPGVIRTSRVLTSTGDTGFVQDANDAGIPLGRQGEPEDIADAVQYLTMPLSADVTGQVIPVNGGGLMH
jgi:3-oxoacyl-[acyl-carrier protein] reductase